MSEQRPPVDREAIRSLVRQVLRDLLPDAAKAKLVPPSPSGSASQPHPPQAVQPQPAAAQQPRHPQPVVEEVSLSSDADLAAFVRRVLSLSEDASAREALRSGRHRFRLRHTGRAPAAGPGAGGGEVERIAKGAVTEGKVIAAAKAGKRLVLGKGVVLTPLARDKVRQLGLEIERE